MFDTSIAPYLPGFGIQGITAANFDVHNAIHISGGLGPPFGGAWHLPVTGVLDQRLP